MGYNGPLPQVVKAGGTGIATTTAYGVILGGTTATGNFQNAGAGTSGQHLTSGGASAVPSYKSFSIVQQTFTANGTYTPTSGMQYCIIECVGGGGAGGGAAATGATTGSVGAGGGGGEYGMGVFSASAVGASKSVTIGTAGAASSGAAGGAGGTTSVGTLVTAAGGSGGNASGASAIVNANGGLGGTGGTGGTVYVPGNAGGWGYANVSTTILNAGQGGSSRFGAGGNVDVTTAHNQGLAGVKYGAGGGGSCNFISQSALSGGAGTAGFVVVTEYVWA